MMNNDDFHKAILKDFGEPRRGRPSFPKAPSIYKGVIKLSGYK